MNILNLQIKSKTVGIVILISSLLILIFTIVSAVFLIPFGLASGVSVLMLIPFILLGLFVLIVSGSGIYVGIRYINNNGFKKNNTLGTLLVMFGLIYFVYSLTSYLFSNLTGNTGGVFQPIIAFLWAIMTIPFGLILRNGTK